MDHSTKNGFARITRDLLSPRPKTFKLIPMNKFSWKPWVLQTFLLAVTYYITGKLGLLWATPPGYASPVWPPTGLGIAALLLFGINRWPGIFVGAFLINYTTAPTEVAAWTALGIAIGNTSSLIFASLLIKKGLDYPKAFYREKDFLLYLLIAGPFAGFISSTIGVSTLYFTELIHSGNFSMNWLHWFIGDATGGIIFAPLALIFSIKSRRFWMKSVKTVLLPLFVFFTIVVGAIHYLNKVEKDKVISEFTKKSEMVLNLVEKDVVAYQGILATLQSFYLNSQEVTSKEFQDFTRALNANHPEIQTLGWIPFHPTNKNTFLVRFVEPLEGNEVLLNSDLGTNPTVRDILQRASQEKKVINFAPVLLEDFHHDTENSFWFLAARTEKGVLFEIVHLNKVLTTLTDFLNDPSYRIQIKDISEETPLLIVDSIDRADSTAKKFYNKALTWTAPLEVGDRLWQISLHQDPSLRIGLTFSTSIFLFATLLFTFLICSLLLAIANSFVTVQEIVNQKTLYLRELNLQLEKASKTKSDFLANMSHEIRTPLNVLLGMADLLEESSLDKEQRHYVDISKKAGQNLLNIVNDILDISKIEAGLVSLEKTDVDLEELATEVHEMFSLRALEKGLQLTLNISDDVRNVYQGDPTRIRQILSNLVANAVKFTEEGHIDVLITPNLHPQRPGNILFQVKDTGIGIPSDKLAHLFQPFTQADSTITRKFGGTGLGLSICKRLTEMMNGDVQVQSQVHQGSTFSFTLDLPVIRKADKSHKKKTEELVLPLSNDDSVPLRILVADDTEDNRTLIRAFLKDTPHTVLEAENGVKAFEIFKEGHLDLILMDMQMPTMDGFTATLEIRQWEKSTNQTPVQIWALTAYALKNEIAHSFDVGCNLHLVKPLKRSDLLHHLHEMIRTRQNK